MDNEKKTQEVVTKPMSGFEEILANSLVLPGTFAEVKAAHENTLLEIRQKQKELADLKKKEQSFREHRHYKCYVELREASESLEAHEKTVTIPANLLEEAWGIIGGH